MSTINYDLTKIKSFIFDVDGVLSCQTVPLSEDGQPLRTTNVRDGYAIHHAVRSGFDVAVITGGRSEIVRRRLESLGVRHIYLKSRDKTVQLKEYMEETGFVREEIVYVGDDIIDYLVMKEVGLPVAPADACPEIKEISIYISPVKGGEGVARDVIEQVLKVQGKWMVDDAFYW
ncbi:MULTISPECIES: KdsC family phosphatase [Petrimonas]|jgi:3-deoxy-D-manno-octulosonate 8-phosphate phosphatase (KDO 8-P phosphatase)|uniref:3-deoxy-D-manno-octulosonate 8-phosphate phosphatase KdsC n=1 Tax=Petrimonas mucosa TaxID=1642646 RepID=A0A1G4G5H9_9BACT|nr:MULTISPECIES: HAD hydrolase family protein [Petrimonas]MDD3560911.1 HAD hydrolase family protein [Petrimonas mucosa]SCM56606.1 3-deoxy-D-manno-octulosonate 8-phosphate phosphatase KdsC [Petrimonas mucosa]HHT29903.1 HAD hydrolase family protein [Petrimonas mucosa]